MKMMFLKNSFKKRRENPALRNGSNKIRQKVATTNEGPKQLCLSKFFSTSKTTDKSHNC